MSIVTNPQYVSLCLCYMLDNGVASLLLSSLLISNKTAPEGEEMLISS